MCFWLIKIYIFRVSLVISGLIVHFFLPNYLTKYAFKLCLLGLGTFDTTESEFQEYNDKILHDFYENESKGVMLFNHPSFLDTFVLPSFINKNWLRPVAYGPIFRFPLNLFSDTFNPIYVQSSSTGASKIIKEAILSRNKCEPFILVAPGGSDKKESQRVMTKFRNGAFIARAPILPVIIRYTTNVDRWPIILSLLKRLMGLPVYFKIRVLNPIYPKENESLDDLKDRVKNYMESVPDYSDLHF